MKKTSFFGLGFALIISFLLCSCSDNTYLTGSGLSNVVAVFYSSNTINIAANTTQNLTVNFVTTTANATANNLTITSSLPTGWSQTSFNCTQVTNNANNCTLILHYAPTTAQSGIFSISYSYDGGSGNSNIISYTSNVYAYVAYSNTSQNIGYLEYCSIASDGTLSNCNNALTSVGRNAIAFTDPVTSMAFHNGYLYVTTYKTGGTLYYCSLATSGMLSCAESSLVVTTPIGINFSGNTAYVLANNNPSVTNLNYCSVNNSTGDLTGCNTTGSNMANPGMIDVSSATEPMAYITNPDDTDTSYTLCNVQTGALVGCARGTNPTGIVPARIRLSGNNAYVTNNTNSLYLCPLQNSGALPSSCTSTGSGFSTASDISFHSALAYVVNFIAGGNVSVCTVSGTDGSLTGCTSALGTTDYPTSVAFNG